MTDSEKLDLIFKEVLGLKDEVKGLKTEVQEMKTEIQQIKADIQELREEIKDIRAEMQVMKAEIEHMKTEIQQINERVDGLDAKISRLQLHIENVTDKNISLLAENHLTLINKLNQSIRVSDRNIYYEIKVNYLIEKVDKIESELIDIKKKIA